MSDSLKQAVKKISRKNRLVVIRYWYLVKQLDSGNFDVLDEYLDIQDVHPELERFFDLDKWA